MNLSESFSNLGLDSFGGAASFVASVALTVAPFLWKRNRKRKKREAKLAAATANAKSFAVVENTKNWVEASAKITSFGFAKTVVVVPKKMVKTISRHGENPLVAFTEFRDAGGNIHQAPVFMGDEIYNEGEVINIKYNPLDKLQAVLA